VTKKDLWISAVIMGVILGVFGVVNDTYRSVWTMIPLTFGVWFVFLIVIIWSSIKKQRDIIKILMVEGQPELYLQRMKVLKDQIRYDKYKRLIELNIATGLIYEGNVESALEIIENLSLRGFSPMHKGVYYNNLAFAYLMNNRIDESQEIFKKHIGEMLAADRDPTVKSCARCTQAILDYKQNRNSVALETLERLLQKDLMPLQKAVVLYYKGLILKEMGKGDVSQVFRDSAAFAGNTIFKNMSNNALNSL